MFGLGLAIREACVILASKTLGDQEQRGMTGGETRHLVVQAEVQRDKRFQKFIHRRAAKVERAACAFGDTFSVTGFHLCMYSTDTLHPSP